MKIYFILIYCFALVACSSNEGNKKLKQIDSTQKQNPLYQNRSTDNKVNLDTGSHNREIDMAFIDSVQTTDKYWDQMFKIDSLLTVFPLEEIFDFSKNNISHYKKIPITLKKSTNTYLDSIYVSEFGILDTTGNYIYYYAQYKYPINSGIILPIGICIFRSRINDSILEPIILRVLGDMSIYEDCFYKPDIIKSSYGKIMIISVYLSGNSHYNENEYFLITNNRVREIDDHSWAMKFVEKHPKWNPFYNGIEINMKTFTATGGIWLENDPHCCPSVGVFKYYFGLDDTTIYLKKYVKISDRYN